MEPLVAAIVLSALLLAVCVTDLRERRIPDLLNALIFLSGLAATWILRRDVAAALIGAAAGYLVIAALNLAFRRLRGRDGIGMGDAKFLAGLGAWVLWWGLPFVVLMASAAGLAVALLRRQAPGALLPFGPFLAAGGLTVWIVQIYS